MTRSARLARWAAVLVATVAIAALPGLINALPGGASTGAVALLQRVQRSGAAGYSGYAEAAGGIGLPVTTSQFGSVADLLGGTTTLRAWWRSGTDFRVDAVAFSGEIDTYRDASGIWTWDYERNQAVRFPEGQDAPIRLPRDADLLPPELGRRLLSEATAAEVRPLTAQRIAGRRVPGLEVVPADEISTISRVDVWADPDTGLALRVIAYGRSGPPVVDTQFLDVQTVSPRAGATAFYPPIGAKVQTQADPDLISAIDRFGGVRPPTSLADLPVNGDAPTLGAVRTYGRGVTELVVGSLPGRLAPGLRDELSKAPGAAVGQDRSVALSVGPLSVLVGPPGPGNAAWVLVGTVTPETLTRALTQLPAAGGLRR